MAEAQAPDARRTWVWRRSSSGRSSELSVRSRRPASRSAGRTERLWAALQVADYGYVLKTGEVVIEGASECLAEDPRVAPGAEGCVARDLCRRPPGPETRHTLPVPRTTVTDLSLPTVIILSTTSVRRRCSGFQAIESIGRHPCAATSTTRTFTSSTRGSKAEQFPRKASSSWGVFDRSRRFGVRAVSGEDGLHSDDISLDALTAAATATRAIGRQGQSAVATLDKFGRGRLTVPADPVAAISDAESRAASAPSAARTGARSARYRGHGVAGR